MKSAQRFAGFGLALAVVGCAQPPSVPPPLPPQVSVVLNDSTVSAALRPWLGRWSGKLFAKNFGNLEHILVVERVEGNTAHVVFARGPFVTSVGDVPAPGWFRAQGPVTAETLTFKLSDGTEAIYRLGTAGTLGVQYFIRPPGFTASGTLKRDGT